MRKRNLFLPLFLGSFFMPTTLDAAVFDLYKSNNDQSDLLIASPGGHGGGMTPKEKAKKKKNAARSKLNFLIRLKKELEATGGLTDPTLEERIQAQRDIINPEKAKKRKELIQNLIIPLREFTRFVTDLKLNEIKVSTLPNDKYDSNQYDIYQAILHGERVRINKDIAEYRKKIKELDPSYPVQDLFDKTYNSFKLSDEDIMRIEQERELYKN